MTTSPTGYQMWTIRTSSSELQPQKLGYQTCAQAPSKETPVTWGRAEGEHGDSAHQLPRAQGTITIIYKTQLSDQHTHTQSKIYKQIWTSS